MALQNLPYLPKKRKSDSRRRKNRRRKPHTSPACVVPIQENGEVFCNVPARIVVPKPYSLDEKRILKPNLVVNPHPTKLTMYRESQRWCKEYGRFTRKAVRSIPFITREGFISSNSISYWECTATQWVATVSATVYQRIVGRWSRWTVDGDRVMPNRDLALRIAVLYTLTMDSNRLTRVIECAKRNEDACRRMVYHWSRKVDAPIGFWYGQLCSTGTGSWLQHRALRARDKSTNLLAHYRLIEVFDKSGINAGQKFLNNLTDPWIRRLDNYLETPLLKFNFGLKKRC